MSTKTIRLPKYAGWGLLKPLDKDVIQVIQPYNPIKVVMTQEHYFQLLEEIGSYKRKLGLLKETPVPIDTSNTPLSFSSDPFLVDLGIFSGEMYGKGLLSQHECGDIVTHMETFKLARTQMSAFPMSWLGRSYRSPEMEWAIEHLAKPLQMWIDWLKASSGNPES